MLTLICAPSGYGKTHTMYSKIEEVLKNSPNNSLYVIVPEQESVKAEKSLLEHFGNKLNKQVEILNFTRLANRVFREAGGITYKYVDNGGKDLIVATVLEDAAESFGSISRGIDDERFVGALRSELDTLRLAGVAPETLTALSRDIGEKEAMSDKLCEKISDMAALYTLYEGALKHGNVDSTDDLTRLAETLEDYDFFYNTDVFIDGFYDFTYPEYKIIEKMLSASDNVFITLPLIENDTEDVFTKSREAKRQLSDICEKLSVEIDVINLYEKKRKQSEALEYLTYRIVDGKVPSEKDRVKANGALSLTYCQTPFDECIYTAREIVKLVKNGAKFSDIAVCAGNIDEYGTMLEDVFKKYSIRFLSTARESLISKPLVSLIFSALEAIKSGFYLPKMKRYLENPLLPLNKEDIFCLSNYISVWNINSSLWKSEKDWVMNPRGYIETVFDEDRELLLRINKARRTIISPLLALAEGMKKEKVRDKVEAIWKFLQDIHVEKKLKSRADKFLEASDFSRSREEADVWNLTLGSLDKLCETLGDRNTSFDRFVKYMRIIFADSTFGRIPSSIDEVELGNIGFVRNENVKHLFLIGFNEGSFPSADTPRSIFTESERHVLEKFSDFYKNTSEEKMLQNEVFALLVAISMPEKTLQLVCHTAAGSSSDERVSFFASTLSSYVDFETNTFDQASAFPVCKNELLDWAIMHRNDSSFENVTRVIRESDPDFADEIVKRVSMSDFDSENLSFKSPEKVFSSNLSMTQARLDTFSKCPFSYYSNYLLHLRSKKKAEFKAAEMGSLVHKVLEDVLAKITSSDKKLPEVDPSEVERMARASATEYIRLTAPEIVGMPGRFRYMISRLTTFVVYVIDNMRSEFENSDFEPYLFEEQMQDEGKIPPYTVDLPRGGKLVFYGCVDRVDIFEDDDGTKYLRVVDYKTKIGGKKFNLNDVINGINLQLLVYLFAIWQNGEADGTRPAGIMYMPASRPSVMLSAAYEVEAENETRNKEMKRSGLFLLDEKILSAMEHGLEGRVIPIKKNKDGNFSSTDSLATLEQFGALKRYTDKTFVNIAMKMKRGEIEASPFIDSDIDSCAWCDFKPFCRYEGCGRLYLKTKDPWLEITSEDTEE